MSLIFVDCEADFNSPCPGLTGEGMTEFGAVEAETRKWFHGRPHDWASSDAPAWNESSETLVAPVWTITLREFATWLSQFKGRPIFVSDNPAYDWQWINYHFWKSLGRNPFGHSARRIGDFYAGLVGDFRQASRWKALRVTNHDHNPVNDAMGNVEAFVRMLAGERA